MASYSHSLLPFGDATATRLFRGTFFRNLDLEDKRTFAYRVYVLLCMVWNGYLGYYVGIIPTEKLERRLQKHGTSSTRVAYVEQRLLGL